MKEWKHKIAIKHLFENDTTPELIVQLCTQLSVQLIHIENQYQNSSVGYELKEVRENFEFLKELADGTIPENEWHQYSFDGDFEELFNGYLSELYDIADNDKLIWID